MIRLDRHYSTNEYVGRRSPFVFFASATPNHLFAFIDFDNKSTFPSNPHYNKLHHVRCYDTIQDCHYIRPSSGPCGNPIDHTLVEDRMIGERNGGFQSGPKGVAGPNSLAW
jgi:hypothetical protein